MSARSHAAARLESARLYLVVEGSAAHVVDPALRGGVDLVQLRDKQATDEQILAAAGTIRAVCERHGATFVVNDRPDLALAAGADAVHLGQDDADVETVRAEVGDRLAIGLSTHSPDQIAAAERSSADYYAVGPVHETPTKPGRPAVGLELVSHAARVATKPWFAIGGIDPSNVAEVAAAGARRIVVVRAIRDAPDTEAAARALAGALRSSRSEAKDAAARAALVPLRRGERPLAVTIGALVLAVLATANAILFAAGAKIAGKHEPRVLAYSVLMGIVAAGMWRGRYWAVVLMQAILTIVMLYFSLIGLKASNLGTAAICIAFIAGAATLFWFLVKAMARIQMPERRPE